MVALFGRGNTNLFEGFNSSLFDFAAPGLDVLAQHIFNLMANLAYWIERGPWVLEDHCHFPAAQIAHGRGRVRDVNIRVVDFSAGNSPGAVQNAHDGVGSNGFSRS